MGVFRNHPSYQPSVRYWVLGLINVIEEKTQLIISMKSMHKCRSYGLNGWLVGCFGFKGLFETVFQSMSGRLPERGRKRREKIEESKNVQTTPPAPTASTVGPCPTKIQISRTPRHRKFTQHHRTTRPPQL